MDELRELLERHVRPDLATAIDGVRICKADHAVSLESAMSGTVLAVIAQGRERLALGDIVQVTRPPRSKKHTKHPRRLQRRRPNPGLR